MDKICRVFTHEAQVLQTTLSHATHGIWPNDIDLLTTWITFEHTLTIYLIDRVTAAVTGMLFQENRIVRVVSISDRRALVTLGVAVGITGQAVCIMHKISSWCDQAVPRCTKNNQSMKPVQDGFTDGAFRPGYSEWRSVAARDQGNYTRTHGDAYCELVKTFVIRWL